MEDSCGGVDSPELEVPIGQFIGGGGLETVLFVSGPHVAQGGLKLAVKPRRSSNFSL